MKQILKRILPILLVIVVIFSIVWYLFVYDTGFTKDMMLKSARFFERRGNHSVATWIYDQAYRQSSKDESVAIELAEQFKSYGNYTKAEVTLSNAIADGGSVELYLALSKTYVEQDKLYDAVLMLENVSNPEIKQQLEALRPQAPTANLQPGFYNKYVTVAVEAESGTLYVSADKEYPSKDEDLYQGPIQLAEGETTFYALAIGENGLVSPLAVFGYTVGNVVEEVTMKDSTLEALAHEKLGIAADQPILTSDLWKITELTVPKEVKDYSDLFLFTGLETLVIEDATFNDLQFLQKMPNLKSLTIKNSVVSSGDLSFIAALQNLKDLVLTGCSIGNIENLATVSGLVTLDLSDNAIRNLTALSSMTALEHLNLSHNAVDDLSALSALSSLKTLDVSYNTLSAIAPLEFCTALESINLAHNTIEDLAPLQGCASLNTLDASYNKLTSANALAKFPSLVKLNLARNEITEIAELSTLVKLKDFDISYNQIGALPKWSSSALETIQLSYNKVRSLSALSACTNLREVYADHNKISNVSTIAKCSNLKRVDVYGNPVKDVSSLRDNGVTVNYDPT